LRATPVACTIRRVRIGRPSSRRFAVRAGLVALALAAPASAGAHDPGTYGGVSDRTCGVAADRMLQVGATRVSCRVARRVAAGVVRGGDHYRRWRCPGAREGSGYGHCHGRGSRRGAIVHWGLND
jgi:hypothetical protein